MCLHTSDWYELRFMMERVWFDFDQCSTHITYVGIEAGNVYPSGTPSFMSVRSCFFVAAGVLCKILYTIKPCQLTSNNRHLNYMFENLNLLQYFTDIDYAVSSCNYWIIQHFEIVTKINICFESMSQLYLLCWLAYVHMTESMLYTSIHITFRFW